MNHVLKEQTTDLFEHVDQFSEQVSCIYEKAVDEYHLYDSVNKAISNPFTEEFQRVLYLKCWIDTVQWHIEDAIRDPEIDPSYALSLKRRIDQLNQERTNQVELIDNYLLMKFCHVQALPTATVNTESPAWALDRLSILILKIYHMKLETQRKDTSKDHISKCSDKLTVLCEQLKDLSMSINQLVRDISQGNKYMKVYKQMKMYNDPNLNPVLYNPLRSA